MLLDSEDTEEDESDDLIVPSFEQFEPTVASQPSLDVKDQLLGEKAPSIAASIVLTAVEHVSSKQEPHVATTAASLSSPQTLITDAVQSLQSDALPPTRLSSSHVDGTVTPNAQPSTLLQNKSSTVSVDDVPTLSNPISTGSGADRHPASTSALPESKSSQPSLTRTESQQTVASLASSTQTAAQPFAENATCSPPPGKETSTASLAEVSFDNASLSRSDDAGPILSNVTASVNVSAASSNVTTGIAVVKPNPTRQTLDSSSSIAVRPVHSTSSIDTTYAASTRLPALHNALPGAHRRNETRQPLGQVIYTHASHPQPNESIYGTIMKRLVALEFNSTLTTTYIEEHTRTVWSALKRIEDKMLNLEKSVRDCRSLCMPQSLKPRPCLQRSQQDQLLRRLMLDLELHRARIESERVELSAQISMLSREMVLEKRLGMVQLLALVILLLFVILTRGSPSTPFVNIASPPTTATSAFSRGIRPRPRSFYERPEGLPRLSGDFSLSRDRRQYNQERRSHMHTGSISMSRTGSVKKTSRPSCAPKRATSPTHGIPFRLAADHTLPSNALSPGPSTASFSHTGEVSGSLPSSTVSPIAAPLVELVEEMSRPTSSATVRNSTGMETIRSSSVEAIKRRFKLLQPMRAGTFDSTPTQAPVRPYFPASAPEKRRLFILPPKMRRRSTVASADADEEDGPRKAWLSTSEDSADDSSTRQNSFNGISRSTSQPSVPFPPSPEPSDAEPHVS